jgi:F-type H+-transporting ATPase subunit delta
MAEFDTAARPYAKAFFELAQEEGRLDAWQDSLDVAAAIAADADMRTFIDSPDALPREIGEVFLSVLEGAGHATDQDFSNAIRLLAENSRLAALPAIALQYAALKQEAEGRIEVRVVSAQELSAEQQQQIAESMAKRLGKQVTLSAEVDESLIAGAVITAGDLVIDGSASGRIEKLVHAVNR